MDIKVKKISGYTSDVTAVGAKFNISASVNVNNNVLSNINNASVLDISTNQQIATFSAFPNLNLNYNTQDISAMTDALSDIVDFVSACKSDTSTFNTVSV